MKKLVTRVWNQFIKIQGVTYTNQSDIVRTMKCWGAFIWPLLPWNSNNITYSECVSPASVIQNAKRTHHIALSSVSFSVLPYFSTLPYKRNNFRKKLLNAKFVWTFLTLRRIGQNVVSVKGSSCKVLVIFLKILMKI